VDEEQAMKQKLVTIYVDNMAYANGKMMVGSFAEERGWVEEHLESYLADGWHIGAIPGFGGNSESDSARGWFSVVLEK
jgi:hypothetical protein